MPPVPVPTSDRDLQTAAALKALQDSSMLLSKSIGSGREDQIENCLQSFRVAKSKLLEAIAHLTDSWQVERSDTELYCNLQFSITQALSIPGGSVNILSGLDVP
jgi:hypothetical protein